MVRIFTKLDKTWQLIAYYSQKLTKCFLCPIVEADSEGLLHHPSWFESITEHSPELTKL